MKKKKNKSFIFGIIALIGMMSTVAVFAGQYGFYLSIPRTQGYAYTTDSMGNGYITGASSNHANVYLQGFTGIEAVTFYAGALSSSGDTWGKTGGVIYRADFESGEENEVTAPYGYTYGNGQKMGMRARNHNWSLNTGGVSGVVDYH